MRNRYRLFHVLVLLAIGVSVALAQMGTGRVIGGVEDPDGQPIEGAVITATGEDGKTFEDTSGSDGKWAILGFRSGMWDFTVVADGYIAQAYKQQIKGTGRNPPMFFKLVAVPEERSGGGSMLGEANAMFENGQYEEALIKYEAFLAAEPMTYQIYNSIGAVHVRLEEYDKAIASYEKVLAEEPLHVGALIGSGDAKVQQQKFDEAVVFFEKAIDQTEDEIVPFNVAEIYFDRGETDRAIELYTLASERKPEWQDPLLKLAYAHLNKGDMDAAKASLEACVAVAPDTTEGQTASQMLQSPAFAN